jgi:OOP family OmpA-OmpF porin
MRTRILAIPVFGLALAACAGQTAAVQTTSAMLPAPNADGEYQPPWPVFGEGQTRFITLQLGPDLYQYCRDVSPKFPFDSATTYVQDKDQLLSLASCLNHPGLEARHVLLVGHADPRGSNAYNLALGARRAQAIKEFLVGAGLSADRIDIATRGERDAKGMLPEYSYGYDRRVDIVVTGGAHHP